MSAVGDARKRAAEAANTPADPGAIGRLGEALGAVDRARLQTAAWSTCNGGRSGVDLLYAVVEAIVREHVEAALAGAVSMDRRSTRIDTCVHCGDLVISFGDGFWAHYRGPGSLLTRCQHSVPYGKDATPAKDGRYYRIVRARAEAAEQERDEARAERDEALSDHLCACGYGVVCGQCQRVDRARAEAAESALAAVRAEVDSPAWRWTPREELRDRLRAALATPTTTERSEG